MLSPMHTTAEELEGAPLYEIATLISFDWERPYFGAVPYLNAMRHIARVDDAYGAEDGRTVVLYLLSNLRTYRGPVARLVKTELKRRVGLR